MYRTKTNITMKICVDVLLYAGIACLLGVWFLAKFIAKEHGYGDEAVTVLVVILFTSGIAAVYILYILKKMMKTLMDGDPFVMENVKCFLKMACACAVIGVVYAVKCVLLFSWTTLLVVGAAVMGTLICMTVSGIFRQAVQYKQENDWTV